MKPTSPTQAFRYFAAWGLICCAAMTLRGQAQEPSESASPTPIVYVTWSDVIDDGAEQALRTIPAFMRLIDADSREIEVADLITRLIAVEGHGRGYLEITASGTTEDTKEPLLKISTWCDVGNRKAEFLTLLETFLKLLPGAADQIEEPAEGIKSLRIQDQTIYWGESEKIVISTTLKNAQRDLAAARRGAADPCADDPALQRVRAKVQTNPQSPRCISCYVDVPALLATFGKDPFKAEYMPKNFDAVAHEIGLDGIKSLYWHCDQTEDGPVSRLLMETDGSNRGILNLINQEPLQRADLELIPKNATWGTACNFNLLETWQEAHRCLEALDPNMVLQLDGFMSMSATMIGVNVVDQVLPALGDTWVIYDAPDHGGLMFTGIVLVLEANQPDAINGVFERLTAFVTPLLRQTGYDLTIGATEYEGTPIKYAYIPGLPIPIAPAAAHVDGRIVCGFSPQAVMVALRQADPKLRKDSVLDLADVKRLAGDPSGKVRAFSYKDYRSGARFGYKFMHLLRTASACMLAGPDSTYDPGKLPTLPEVLDRTTAYVGCAMSNDGDYLSEEKGSLFVWDALAGSLDVTSILLAETSVMLPALARARESAKRAVSLANLRGIGQACHIYSNDHEDKFPPDLESLVTGEMLTQASLRSPRDERSGVSYIYIEGQTDSSDTRNVLAYERVTGEEGTSVLFVDGRAEWMNLSDFEDALRKTYERLGRPARAPVGDAPEY